MNTKDKLISILTQYDAKEFARTNGSRLKGYNPNALGIYFQRVDDICADVQNGATVRNAIIAGITGRLQSFVLKKMGLEKPTDDEISGIGKPVYYVPASENK